MNHSSRIKVPANDGISIGLSPPTAARALLQARRAFKAAGIR